MLQDQQLLQKKKKINSPGAQSLSLRKKKSVAICRMQQQQQQSNKLDKQGK
jgi:hypothetical protein